ncbi:ribosome small subunit-dependent GTPase A [Carboxylicivirga linearis]|uniref:Small ribosomal subunit biogenesis GTPase RsgA n=1 Tax=Carboxylicivirga linearis TaxID=1628157 RepID=A0ABS5JR70_9BACT|nr:ribosome small subunit-dependent GTPase A [Carboxylicivirga linearis]MBS2097372.1 ribosome small subunit-dependent GTPase A [Carboxylicivirga linearis]
MSDLKTYGYNTFSEIFVSVSTENIGRVTTVNKTNYKIITESGFKTGELTGQMLYSLSPSELPQTGDWVEIINYAESCIITKVLPRKTTLLRKTAGRTSDVQILATNIDTALIVQGLDRDFNINRLERITVALLDAKIKCIIVMNKIDLDPDWQSKVEKVQNRLPDITIIAISALNNTAIDTIQKQLIPQQTYIMIGSSGAGKSTLLNQLVKKEIQQTQTISTSVGKGRHTTTHREMFVLSNGSLLIDSPGVREFGLALSDSDSVTTSFSDIKYLSEKCKYKNCTHTNEPGCAILSALEDGSLLIEEYNSYLKLRNEAIHYQQTVQEKKKKGKNLAKLIKDMKNKNMKKRYD